MRLIRKIAEQREIVFDKGKFDNWCVYIVEANGSRRAPTDEEYFADLQRLGRKYGGNKIYSDYLKLYELTGSVINNDVLDLVDLIKEDYIAEDRNQIEQWFCVLYAGMVAEENKAGAILKKRIKRLGMFQVLMLNQSPEFAAKFSLKKTCRMLDKIMKDYGF